ncbi:MAG TPA: flavin reductase family protein [Candidatus Omnitrophota bacterium]|nr:flavin reductase family protein [Candidatus Omnitrophota bacterium]HPS36249.1 flavin reductase family protein [Candidatus Omnitrophota bacterium]
MKKSLGARTILFPTPVLIICSYDAQGVPNAMNAAWGGICCSEPPCLTVSVRNHRKTHENILLKKAFTVNIPSEKYIKEADYVGIVSGKDEDKFKATGLTPVKSDLVEAPYIKEFPFAVECVLKESHVLGIHTQFIGEIKDVKVDESVLNAKGFPDIEKMKPFMFDPGTGSYYSAGKYLAQAFSIGKKK